MRNVSGCTPIRLATCGIESRPDRYARTASSRNSGDHLDSRPPTLTSSHRRHAANYQGVNQAGSRSNVAAVSYHYGSLKSLCDVAVAHALVRYLDAQQEALDALDPEATVDEVAAAFARPMVRALAAGGRDLASLRIVARAAIDPPQSWDRFDGRFVGIRADAARLLKANVPGVKEKELLLRVRCAAGMLNWLALAPVSAELGARSEKQLERLLVPIIAGALRGSS